MTQSRSNHGLPGWKLSAYPGVGGLAAGIIGRAVLDLADNDPDVRRSARDFFSSAEYDRMLAGAAPDLEGAIPVKRMSSKDRAHVKKWRAPMTEGQAHEAMDSEIRRTMQERAISYAAAWQHLGERRPNLIANYQRQLQRARKGQEPDRRQYLHALVESMAEIWGTSYTAAYDRLRTEHGGIKLLQELK